MSKLLIESEIYMYATDQSSIVSITDEKGQIIHVNSHFVAISGYKKEELIGKDHRLLNSGEHGSAFFKTMWTTLKQGKQWRGEVKNRAKDGSYYWVDTIITPIWDEDGNIYQYISIRNDITEKKLLEERSLEDQFILNFILEGSKAATFEVNFSEDTLKVNEDFAELFGQKLSDFDDSYTKFLERFEISDWENFQEKLQLLNDDKTKKMELILKAKRADGDVGQFLCRARVLKRDHRGKIELLLGTFSDLSDQLKKELLLKKTQETAQIGSWRLNIATDELEWTDMTYRIFGKSPSSFTPIKNKVEELYTEESRVVLKETLQNCIQSFDDFNIVLKIIHSSGEPIWVRKTGHVEIVKGKPVAIYGTLQNIQKEKEYEQLLVASKEKAMAATNAKSSFLASMSHEIRTPMNGVMGMLDLLAETSMDEEQQNLLKTVQACSENLLEIVNDILDFSKIEAGKMNLEYRQLDIEPLVKNVCDIFRTGASSKGISINYDILPGTPKLIFSDETRLKQVLVNLVSNALKFTEKGSINIEIDLKRKNKESSHGILEFKVKDTGIGIETEKIDKLFELFTQEDESTTRHYGGTGLGLSICKSLVEKMGGLIEAESEKGKGTTFIFTIMAGFEDGVEKEKPIEEISTIEFEDKNFQVLLAEDNEVNQKLAKAHLEKLGVQVAIVGNGQEAIDAIRSYPYDLIFMDMQMPVLDGVDATKNIIELLGEDAPPIVAMTANVFEEDRKRCFDAGMVDFIPKPIKRDLIRTILAKHLNEKSPNNTIPLPHIIKEFPELTINFEKIQFEFGDDMDIFEELVGDYQDSWSALSFKVFVGIEAKDFKAVEINAHTLKGIVSNFYCPELVELMLEIETMGAKQNLDGAKEKLERFNALNSFLINSLQSYFNLKIAA